MNHHQFVHHALSQTPVEHNGETWHVTALTVCTGPGCPQRLNGYGCAGIVDLVNAEDPRWTTDGVHARAGKEEL